VGFSGADCRWCCQSSRLPAGLSSSEMDASAACGTSTLTGAAEAAREAAEMAARGLGGAAVDLALVFVSPQHVGQAQAVAEVVLQLGGGVELRTLVSQGCAPIGPELVVTAAEGNAVLELAGRPAYERLVEVLASLDPERQRLAAGGVLAGLVIDENRAEYGRDDYLIRGVLGADASIGAVYVGDQPRIGQTMRFHIRDAASADGDLRQALRGERALP